MKMVTVIATGVGHDGLIVRQPGETFQMPASMFDKRPKLDKDGKPTGEFYPPPSWFVEAEEVETKTTTVKAKGKKTDGEDLT